MRHHSCHSLCERVRGGRGGKEGGRGRETDKGGFHNIDAIPCVALCKVCDELKYPHPFNCGRKDATRGILG